MLILTKVLIPSIFAATHPYFVSAVKVWLPFKPRLSSPFFFFFFPRLIVAYLSLEKFGTAVTPGEDGIRMPDWHGGGCKLSFNYPGKVTAAAS